METEDQCVMKTPVYTPRDLIWLQMMQKWYLISNNIHKTIVHVHENKQIRSVVSLDILTISLIPNFDNRYYGSGISVID